MFKLIFSFFYLKKYFNKNINKIMFEIIKNNLIYKIFENSIPKLFIKTEQPLGRWNTKNCTKLMNFLFSSLMNNLSL